MSGKKQKKFLTVAPFECAWREELRFREAGRGCVAFEAFAHNDVTLVFREQVGSKNYHYKIDSSPNYTVILGSHRNRRLKIEVDGKTVVDVAGIGLCSSLAFQSYWISVYDGLISIGKGRYPFQDIVFQWLDSNPNCSVQYVGLSSWDKHVGYRNVNVLPLKHHHNFLQSHVDYKEYEENVDEEGEELTDWCKERGLENFLESWELSDMFFIVGTEQMAVPAHMVILDASGIFCFSSSEGNTIWLPEVTYAVLHAFLEYIYTGRTQIVESQLGSLRNLSLQFQVSSLVKLCEDIMDRFKTNKKLFDSGKKVEVVYSKCQVPQHAIFPHELPIDVQKLQYFFSSGKYSDVNIYLDGHGFVAHLHKIILSLWSAPFAKMFTNGMIESSSSEISLRDITLEALTLMLQFMYSGEIELQDRIDTDAPLIPLLLLADQFGVTDLQRECCKCLMECLSEDSVSPIIHVVSTIPSCKLIEEACKRLFAMQFDYCTTANTDFVLLEEETFKNILQHPDLTVTSEERILDAILMWSTHASEVYGWMSVDELLGSATPEYLFEDRFQSMDNLLPFVRFPLMSLPLLHKLENSKLRGHIPIFEQLVVEAIQYTNVGITSSGIDKNVWFQHRQSSFKELQYICDGDKNGVIYYSGTSYGEHQWVNPVLAKKISVTASSPASRYTDPKALVSRAYQATSFAGARREGGQNCSWWMVDIGHDHQLMCNYYTLRQDGSNAFVRSWAIQGSSDGENWTNLRAHENDQTVCQPGQFSSWPIQGPAALLPFRFFRIILTGRTACDSIPWNLCICFLELYGYFR